MKIQPKTIEVYDWKEILEHLAARSGSDEDEVCAFAYDAFENDLYYATGKIIIKLGFVK